MRLLVAILLLVLPAEAVAESVRFPSIAVGNVPAGPELTGSIYRLDGPGPFPAIVLAHPCSGVSRHTDFWGKLISSWGYVVLAPDSFRPRGVTQVCTNGTIVSASRRVADVAGALDFLNSQPFVQRGNIGLIGHSHGGWTVMRAVQKDYGLAARVLKAAVAYYKDDWTPADNCRKLQKAGFTHPELVETIYYPNAHHSFDNKAQSRSYLGHHLAYDATAAPDAELRTKAFVEKYLESGKSQ